jgi:hypothetical protein
MFIAGSTERCAVVGDAKAREFAAFCNSVRERETEGVPVEWGGVRK